MGQKLIISAKVLGSLFAGSMLYTYFYPWLYNKVNGITKRGQDLDDDIDIVNVSIMIITTWMILSAIALLVGVGVVGVSSLFVLKKNKKK